MKRNGLTCLIVSCLALAACTRGNENASDGDLGNGDAAASPDGASCADKDGDGVTDCAGDCDDADASNYPGNTEICGDARDNDCSGASDEGCGGLGTFVSGLTGSDANTGTQASPLKTIAKGIANAVMIGGAQSVIVAGTHYPEKVTLVEGVNLLGGYACDTTACTWAHDPVVNDTAIDNQDFEGVLAGSTITKKTRFEGFRVRGMAFSGAGTAPTATGSACLTLDGASPTVRSDTLVAGDLTAGGANARSIGIAVYAPTADQTGALIEGNRITTGTGAGASIGILMSAKPGIPAAVPAVAVIQRNAIVVGAAPTASGLTAWNSGAGTIVRSNDITGGSSTGSSWGITVGSVMIIDSNKINVDQTNVGTCSGAAWCGGISSASSSTTITNNIVFGPKGGRTTAVLLGEFEVAAGAVALNGNYLDAGGVGLAAATTTSSAIVLSVGNCGACGVNAFVGKIRNNILLGGANHDRFGVFEDPSQTSASRTVHAEALDHNDLFFTAAAGRTDAAYRSMPAGMPGTAVPYATVATMEMNVPIKGGGNPSANLGVDPLADATFHLGKSPLSPCIDSGTATEAPSNDFETDARPKGAGIDIGPDEAQ